MPRKPRKPLPLSVMRKLAHLENNVRQMKMNLNKYYFVTKATVPDAENPLFLALKYMECICEDLHEIKRGNSHFLSDDLLAFMCEDTDSGEDGEYSD